MSHGYLHWCTQRHAASLKLKTGGSLRHQWYFGCRLRRLGSDGVHVDGQQQKQQSLQLLSLQHRNDAPVHDGPLTQGSTSSGEFDMSTNPLLDDTRERLSYHLLKG